MSEWRGFVAWAGRAGLGRKLALTLGVFALLSGFATLAELRGLWPGAGAPHLDQLFLLLNFILLLPLIAIIAWRLVQLWTERRRGLAGSRLHTRLVVLFSLVAVIPTVIVAIFSYLLFSFGVQAWFSEPVHNAVTGSLAVRKPICMSISRRSAPMSSAWRTISTVTPIFSASIRSALTKWCARKRRCAR